MNRTRGRLAATAASAAVMVAGLATVVPPAAVASAQAAAVAVAADETPVLPATAAEKRAALSLVGLPVTTELMLLADRQLVIQIWVAATGREVKASAELAIAGSPEAATLFIRHGITEAYLRDKTQEVRDQETARLARERRQAAAVVVNLPLQPEMLLRSDKDFIGLIVAHPTGPKVRSAAQAAYQGTAEQQLEFLTAGIYSAVEQDVLAEIAANQQADAAEKARLALRAAKQRAYAIIRVVATEGMLVQPDRNVVVDILNGAAEGSEVRAAAAAALDGDAAAITAFIFTGIGEANDRDVAAQRRKEALANRERARVIQTRAENSLVHPRLVDAARAALAGTDAAVELFLREGQYQHLVQSLEPVRAEGRNTFVRRDAVGRQLVISTGTLTPGPGDGRDASWRVVPGLADPLCHSFESVTEPDHFMTVSVWGSSPQDQVTKVFLWPRDDQPWYLNAATWCSQRGPSLAVGVALQSKAFPGRFLRHYNWELYAANMDGGVPWDTGHYYPDDITWHVGGENPTTTGIAYRYVNDDVLRARLGAPAGDEQIDGAIRHRRFQNESSALYWSAPTGAKAMYGNIHAKYLSVGAYNHPALGAPINDETPIEGGWFNHFANGGSIYCKAGRSYLVNGAIKAAWASLGWERSWWGWPTSDEQDIPTDRYQVFENGVLAYNWSAGAVQGYSHAGWAAYRAVIAVAGSVPR